MFNKYFSVVWHDDTKDYKANKYRSVYNKPKIIAIQL